MRIRFKNPRPKLLALLIPIASGCVHYHYHQDALPACGDPGVVRYGGETCDVPTIVEGGAVLVQSPSSGTTREVVNNESISSRVIVSTP